ncbi:MAG: molybdate transport system ATP-binding protein [Thermoleophilaceae bacterium]|nr:molybdate transport system ATP-binding protein [Thermoleophilaceae bacterium]
MLRAEAQARLGDFGLDLAVEVEAGECLALAGPSGAGKTTLLRIVAGLVRPRSGRVECDGEVWLDTRGGIDRPPERRPVGYVFQDYALFPHLSAWRNVAYAIGTGSRAERRAAAHELLERFGIEGLAAQRPATLSGGERQRVALARALARRPRALLLDEPLSALDERTRASASRELGATLRASAVPALLVTHDFAEAAQLGDRIAVVDGGRIVQTGSAEELAARPASAFVADFAGAVVLTGAARPDAGELTRVDLDGGGSILSTDHAEGRVAASVFPWEITIEAAAAAPGGDSARNRLSVEVVSRTTIGNRVRLGLQAGQPLTAELTEASALRLGIRPGDRVTAVWKAAGTRLLPL